MTVPDWWNERRYGLRLHASVATVPSFSPIGESADWYWCHLGSDPLPATAPHPSPMAEVLAYHRDRWAHVERFDDFIPFLSYHRFDPDAHVELALDAGMNYVVQDVKHHDGFCWWDAPGTSRTSVVSGPRRDVAGAIAASCRRRGLVFGTAFSLLDWSDRRDPTEQVLDLVERLGTEILWGSGRVPDTSPVNVAELVERALDLADAQGIQLALNDGWGTDQATFRSFRDRPPAEILRTPWELCRPLGWSSCHNRAERAEHLLSAGALLDVLTESIAKGGNLLVEVGPSVDGSIAEIQARPLRDVGAWVHDHADLVHGSRPFDVWGDAQVRYVRTALGDEEVVGIDLAAGSEVVLAELTPDRYVVSSITADDGASLHWEQHRGGVAITRIDRSPSGLAGTYRIRLHPAAEAIRLFEERTSTPAAVQPLLDGAIDGTVIQLPEGTHQGPVVVPAGVTLRGHGWDRTAIVGTGGAGPLVRLGAGARVEHIDLAGSRRDGACRSAATVVTVAAGAAVVGCRCSGLVAIEGDDASVISVIGTGVRGAAERTTIERCAFRGDAHDVGVQLVAGSGHRIHRNELVGHLAGVRLTDSSASSVAENRIESRWWAVHLVRCDHVEVADNTVQHTMRAIDVEGGNGSVVTGNWVADGDSGALVELGANETAVVDNHVERCRVGIVVWDASTSRVGPNTFVDLLEEASVVHGPDSDPD